MNTFSCSTVKWELIVDHASLSHLAASLCLGLVYNRVTRIRVIIKAESKGRESGPKIRSKFGQSNNNTKLAPIGMKFGT